MKKALTLALGLVLLAGQAFGQAQVLIPNTAEPGTRASLTALADKIWLPNIAVSDFSTAASFRIVAPTPGFLDEAWLVINSAGGSTATVLKVGFALSKRNGAMTSVTDSVTEAGLLKTPNATVGTGLEANVTFPSGRVRVEEGDVIVFGFPTNANIVSNTAGMLTLRIGAF